MSQTLWGYWFGWDDNARIGAWPNSLDRRLPWYCIVSPLLKTNNNRHTWWIVKSYILCIHMDTSNIIFNFISNSMDFFRIMAYGGRIIADILLSWGKIKFNTMLMYFLKLFTKGQLNSEWIYEVIISPKMPTKNLKDFCPGSLLDDRAEIQVIFGWHFGRNDDLINSFWI